MHSERGSVQNFGAHLLVGLTTSKYPSTTIFVKEYVRSHSEFFRMSSTNGCLIEVILGMNGVAMARHGPILNHSEATGSRKLSRCLPGPKNAIK